MQTNSNRINRKTFIIVSLLGFLIVDIPLVLSHTSTE
jgi:hypothetical protein